MQGTLAHIPGLASQYILHTQDAWNTKNPEKVSLAYTPGEHLQDDIDAASIISFIARLNIIS